MYSMVIQLLLGALALIQSIDARPEYANNIPNGFSVPNPGPQGGVWAGVGHLHTGGGGQRNQFGDDFAAAGFEWTIELCETDSDGDGRSNGVELGDPDCEWIVGAIPSRPAMSHPGMIDEPTDSITSLSCDDYVPPDDEKTVDIVFGAPSVMDESQPHYRCEQRALEAPDAKVFHQIKTSVLLDNPEVLHHMFVYICPTGTTSSDGDRVGQGTYNCQGVEGACQRIAGWAIGPHDSCLPENVGTLLDFSDGEKFTIKIEAHYDNTSGQPQQDQSGMRLHLTPTLRPLRSGQVVTGMPTMNRDFEIPANQTRFSLVNICPTQATENLDKPVYVYKFTPHMHLYGRSLTTEHYRCGRKIGEVGRIDTYEFDNQQSYGTNRPTKILPGDALVTTCTYDTTNTESPINGGESTMDEMCYNFLSFYPFIGTKDSPTLFSACFSFENGIQTEKFKTDFRFAIADRNRDAVVVDFDSDPLQSYAPCCETNSCEELYLEGAGGACAIDSDCLGHDLVCLRGLCGEGPPPTTNTMTASPPSSTAFPPTASPVFINLKGSTSEQPIPVPSPSSISGARFTNSWHMIIMMMSFLVSSILTFS